MSPQTAAPVVDDIAAPDAPADDALSPSRLQVVEHLAIDKIGPSPLNPRKHFGDLGELAASIAAQGVITPLIVRVSESADPPFEIVEGERRYRAALLGGLTELPVLVRAFTDAEAIEIMLLSAIQRQDLTPLEEARGYQALLSQRSKYSPAYIADRISRSVKYVADRLRLLDLIPTAQELLEAGTILVGHAELLAKLKPEDQARAMGIDDASDPERGGLWESVGRTLEFDDEDETDPVANPFRRLKPVTVRELEAWIARHVRFDVEHAAKTAPLDFGETAIAVETAQQQPGRGRKVIEITEDYRAEDDVRALGGKVYGRQSWKRADGSTGTTRTMDRRGNSELVDSPTCEHSVLGVVAAGPGYGSSFQVCIAKDRCQVHWADEIREREKAAKARENGTAKAKAKAAPQVDWAERNRLEELARKREQAAFKAVHPTLVAAITKAVPSTVDRKVFELLFKHVAPHGAKRPDVKPAKFAQALVLTIVGKHKPDSWNAEHHFAELVGIAQHLGVDTKAIKKAHAEQLAAAKADAAPKAAAKSAKKAAKKR
jgi:ParB/RepB/Spo0J family partition protein